MSRLAGDWKLDLKASQSIVDNLLDGQMPEDASMAEKLARGAVKSLVKQKVNQTIEKTGGEETYSMTLEFRTDGTWNSETDFPMAKGEKSGLWKVIKEDGDELQIGCHWTDPKSGKTENFRTTVHFVKPDEIRLVPPNMNGLEMELTFRRQPAK